MSDPKYASVGDPVDHLIEELAELIKELCKAKRFGWFGSHPEEPSFTNMERVKREMSDVVEQIERVEQLMRQEAFCHYERPGP